MEFHRTSLQTGAGEMLPASASLHWWEQREQPPTAQDISYSYRLQSVPVSEVLDGDLITDTGREVLEVRRHG